MSESYETPPSEGSGGPMGRPSGDGLPPKIGGDLHRPGAEDSVDAGETNTGDRGEDVGGMLGEG
jgi:hypothetical protein